MRTCLWAAIAGIVGWAWQPVKAGSPSFVPAYVQGAMKPYQLILFPLDGPEITVPLPAKLPAGMTVLAFSPDGKSIYSNPLGGAGIYKIEFQPTRSSVVPGSSGLSGVLCLTVSPGSGRIVVFSRSMNGGIFEIDPAAATNRPLPAGSPSSCGGAGGLLSPDGQRAIKKTGKQIELVEVKTGEDRVIEGVTPDTSCVWSPNGHSIACVRDGEIVIINANDAARQRNLGAGIGPVEWSPDSKHLLFRISQLSCLLTLYFDSLEVLDIETAKRTLVKNSHCQVTAGPHGWIDPTVATK